MYAIIAGEVLVLYKGHRKILAVVHKLVRFMRLVVCHFIIDDLKALLAAYFELYTTSIIQLYAD
jgi:hypothetical protein